MTEIEETVTKGERELRKQNHSGSGRVISKEN